MSPDGKPGVEISSELLRTVRQQALQIVHANLEEARTQHPLDIPRIFEHDRPTLNGAVPIELYRTVRLLAFREVVGSKISAAILGVSGRSVAKKMGVRGIEELLSTLKEFALGRISIEEQTDDRLVLTVTECATCSGAPNIGEPLCYFEAGFIAGAMDGELAEHVRADETMCWGLGDRVCRWEVRRDGRKDCGNGADTLEVIMSLASRAAFAMENGIAVRVKNRELRRAYEQLTESERVKKDLTDMIVHDMRVPVNAVMGSIETLSDIMDTKLTPRESKLLEMALSSGRAAANMIDDLLDISRLEQQKMTLRKVPVSVGELIERAVNQVGILARKKQIDLETVITSGLPPVDVDRGRIVRVLVNLLSNAVQHTAPGGGITVTAREGDRNCVLIQVRDTGVGIPEEYHARIFDKFVQVESHKSRKRASTGLGLTFCKLVTEAHGGSIWVESSPGAGSTFAFSLPLD